MITYLHDKLKLDLPKSRALTIIIGAQCADGMVIVGDLMMTYDGASPQYKGKLFGELRGVIYGFVGGERTHDTFRKYFVGDSVIMRDSGEGYTFDNIITKLSTHVERFNQLLCNDYPIQILVGLHPKRELWWVDKLGKPSKIEYRAIGHPEAVPIADVFCQKLPLTITSMKEFAKYACLAIKYIERVKPESGVGTGGKDPVVWYLPKTGDDKTASEEDLAEFREYAEREAEEAAKALERK